MNDVTMRYKEEHAEDKDIITAKEKEIRMIQKVCYIIIIYLNSIVANEVENDVNGNIKYV